MFELFAIAESWGGHRAISPLHTTLYFFCGKRYVGVVSPSPAGPVVIRRNGDG